MSHERDALMVDTMRYCIGGLKVENDDMREVIVRIYRLLLRQCEAPHEQYHGKPCESCAEAGTDDCPTVIARQLRGLGIEVNDEF